MVHRKWDLRKCWELEKRERARLYLICEIPLRPDTSTRKSAESLELGSNLRTFGANVVSSIRHSPTNDKSCFLSVRHNWITIGHEHFESLRHYNRKVPLPKLQYGAQIHFSQWAPFRHYSAYTSVIMVLCDRLFRMTTICEWSAVYGLAIFQFPPHTASSEQGCD